jgi:hypothetical protein
VYCFANSTLAIVDGFSDLGVLVRRVLEHEQLAHEPRDRQLQDRRHHRGQLVHDVGQHVHRAQEAAVKAPDDPLMGAEVAEQLLAMFRLIRVERVAEICAALFVSLVL